MSASWGQSAMEQPRGLPNSIYEYTVVAIGRATQVEAAILSADVVGYSRLMAANEAVTDPQVYRDIIARLIVRHAD
jgi:class 3 adenylate cyclase